MKNRHCSSGQDSKIKEFKVEAAKAKNTQAKELQLTNTELKGIELDASEARYPTVTSLQCYRLKVAREQLQSAMMVLMHVDSSMKLNVSSIRRAVAQADKSVNNALRMMLNDHRLSSAVKVAELKATVKLYRSFPVGASERRG
ncbi:hypothetical protein LU351_17840 [Marinibactrum halimedae]|nr:hypothetical protein [Marinibactrum halimedae]MCD9460871.1 hypothetical protein [Marinibactrum halimedae]